MSDKLAPAPTDLSDDTAPPGPLPDEPGRPPRLAMVRLPERLPRLTALVSTEARAECLHRFANHELQAIEMMAWAILRFRDAPAPLRRGLVALIGEEQEHLRLYLARLEAYGVALGDLPVSGNFWERTRDLQDPLAFLCAVGLTFESANLDFALLYRDAFTRAHAPDDAAVMQRVHQEEVGHVRFALTWLRRLKDPAESDLAAYRRATPFPLGLHRAKGRNFVASSRRAAGLDEEFIDAIRTARSPQQFAPRRGG
ncbi:MAG: DUF455 family protein [Myxococcota bacterium]